jgi:hypothetical protein
MCQSGANVMTDQCYFETASIEGQGDHRARERAILTKCQLREESRKQRQIVADQREAMQIRAMIATLDRSVLNLDADIDAELQWARIRDPSHFAFPIAARTMIARRDNLKATIAALSERLAEVDQASTQMVAA